MYFTADLHFAHARIIEFVGRPFPDVAAMDAGLVDAWNDVVRPNDEVWVLGDVTLRHPTGLTPVARLHGHKVLVPGNHDRCWHGHGPQSLAHRDSYLDAGFARILDHPTVVIAGYDVRVSHFPYRGSGDHTDHERFSDDRLVDDGRWLLHGHVHAAWRQRGHQLNVGVDAWAGRPVHADTLARLVRGGPCDRTPLPWTSDELSRVG